MSDVTPAVFPTVGTVGVNGTDDDARARGHAAGFAAGAKDAVREYETRRAALEAEFQTRQQALEAEQAARLKAIDALLAAVEARALPVVEAVQQQIAETAFAVAEAVIGVELGDHEKSAKAAVTRVLAEADASAITTVRMHPDDVALLPEIPGVVLAADESLARGDAIAALPYAFLDARISTALARTREALGVTG